MKISQDALREMQKVSFNLNKEYLYVVDKIADLTNSKRTYVLLALIGKGLDPLMNEMETTWKGLLIAGNLKEEKKKKIEILLRSLRKIREDSSLSFNV